MKLKLNHIVFALLTLLVFSACQNEEIEITDSNAQQLIVPNSTLANLMSRATANEDVDNSIVCVDFVYPISFSVFDSEFNIIDTVTIANDDAFYGFLNSLETNDNALIVSLNFPVTLQYANGNTVEVNSNQDLVDAIEAANDNCEVDLECSLEDISSMLQDCPWNFTDGTDTYNNHQMIFNENGDLLISEGFATSAIGGSWDLSLSNDGSPELVITDLTAFSEGLEGSWIVVDCNIDGELTIVRGDDILELDRDCSTVTFNCFENFDAVIELCDQNNDGFEAFNLTTAFANCITDATIVTYHINQADAEAGINPIPNPDAFTNTTAPQVIYIRVEIDNDFQVFTIELILETCCDNPEVLLNDLVLYMPFSNQAKDLISGNLASSDWSSQVDITNNFVEDRAGNSTCAISFTRTDEITIPVNTQIVQGDSFSISLWFKMQNTEAGDLEMFFRKLGNATEGFQLGVYDFNTPLLLDNLSTSLWDDDWNTEVDVQWENTDWHHLIITVDSNNTIKLYRDGMLRNSIENSDLSIGSETNIFVLGENFEGHLDDLRVYKKTLTPNEISILHNLEADCSNCL